MLIEKQIRDFVMALDTEDVGMSTQLRDGMEWEGEAPNVLNRLIRPSWTVIEMGACLGFYMCLEAKKAKKVYAIEADPHNTAIMEVSKGLNNFSNVEIFNLAIAAENGTVRFAQSPGRSDRGRLSKKGNIKVEAKTLDTFTAENNIGPVDLIRCDIEGAEVHMVSGGRETLKAMPEGSWMFIDLHPLKFGKDKTKLYKAIKQIQHHGFVPRRIFGPKVMHPKDFADSICGSAGFPKVFLRKEAICS